MNRQEVRIIGGDWRGRRLRVADAPGLRPTGDRIRETLFNWLQPIVAGARCLDLFAGTGALGLEAASRGAARVTLVDQHPRAVRQLREHIQILKADRVEALQASALAYLDQPAGHRFDVVFLDPPFDSDIIGNCCALLESRGWLNDTAWIYLEQPVKRPIELPNNWRFLRSKTAGQVAYHLAQRTTP